MRKGSLKEEQGNVRVLVVRSCSIWLTFEWDLRKRRIVIQLAERGTGIDEGFESAAMNGPAGEQADGNRCGSEPSNAPLASGTSGTQYSGIITQ